jgi:hypothetical protein
MPTGGQWLHASAADGGAGVSSPPDEVLEFGRRPLPRWLTVGVLVLGALGAVFAVLTTSRHTMPHRPAAVASEPSARDQLLDGIVAHARLGSPLVSYVRPDGTKGACRLVPVGSDPEALLAARLQATLPGFRLRDSSRTLDQLTQLCELQLRAQDAAGTVLVLQVAAPHGVGPHGYTQVVVTATSFGDTVVSAATARTPTGWTITVGSVGPIADQPSSALLTRLAQDPQLRW